MFSGATGILQCPRRWFWVITSLLWLLYITLPIPVLILHGVPTPPLTQLIYTVFMNVGEDGMGHGSLRPPSFQTVTSYGSMLLKRVFKVYVLFNDMAPGRSGAHLGWTWLTLGITEVGPGRASLVISVGCYEQHLRKMERTLSQSSKLPESEVAHQPSVTEQSLAMSQPRLFFSRLRIPHLSGEDKWELLCFFLSLLLWTGDVMCEKVLCTSQILWR